MLWGLKEVPKDINLHRNKKKEMSSRGILPAWLITTLNGNPGWDNIPCFIAFCLTVLFRYCVFYRLKVCDHPVLSKSISTIFPIALLTSGLCVTFQSFLRYFKLFHYYCIIYGRLWPVIFDVTTTHWRLRRWLEFF